MLLHIDKLFVKNYYFYSVITDIHKISRPHDRSDYWRGLKAKLRNLGLFLQWRKICWYLLRQSRISRIFLVWFGLDLGRLSYFNGWEHGLYHISNKPKPCKFAFGWHYMYGWMLSWENNFYHVSCKEFENKKKKIVSLLLHPPTFSARPT